MTTIARNIATIIIIKTTIPLKISWMMMVIVLIFTNNCKKKMRAKGAPEAWPSEPILGNSAEPGAGAEGTWMDGGHLRNVPCSGV